jgi:hypothetical protein
LIPTLHLTTESNTFRGQPDVSRNTITFSVLEVIERDAFVQHTPSQAPIQNPTTGLDGINERAVEVI